MGIQAPSFQVEMVGTTLPANAALVTASYSVESVTVTSGATDIPTRTVCAGRLSDRNSASVLAMVRPVSGDWPQGPLRVVARGWQRVVAEYEVTVGAAIEGEPPSCAFVSGPMPIHSFGDPGQGPSPPRAGLVYAGLADAHGAVVMITVELAGNVTRHEIGDAKSGGGTIVIGEPFELTRLSITNVLGKTLVLTPPFPFGVAPAGPLGIR